MSVNEPGGGLLQQTAEHIPLVVSLRGSGLFSGDTVSLTAPSGRSKTDIQVHTHAGPWRRVSGPPISIPP